MLRLLLIASLLFTNALWAKGEDIQPGNMYPKVKFETNLGDIIIELDRSKAPLTVNNFLHLTHTKAYDNTIFHRVIKDFVVQGGGVSPNLQQLPDTEAIVNESGNGLKNDFGTIAMAREQYPHSATRQFYFNVNEDGNENLNPSSRRWGYAVFGEVLEGTEVLIKMANTPTGFSERLGWPDVPAQRLVLKTAIVLPES